MERHAIHHPLKQAHLSYFQLIGYFAGGGGTFLAIQRTASTGELWPLLIVPVGLAVFWWTFRLPFRYAKVWATSDGLEVRWPKRRWSVPWSDVGTVAIASSFESGVRPYTIEVRDTIVHLYSDKARVERLEQLRGAVD